MMAADLGVHTFTAKCNRLCVELMFILGLLLGRHVLLSVFQASLEMYGRPLHGFQRNHLLFHLTYLGDLTHLST